jgi:immunity protein, SdpI family
MSTRSAVGWGLMLTAAALIYAVVLYPALPDRIPIHWDINGRVDGWGDKRWAAFLGPGVMELLVLLIRALPWLSPRGYAVETFRGTFNYLMLVLVALMGHVHAVSLQAGLHPERESGRMLVGGLFLFFALMGNVLGKVRRNFWMGVRTPWTLASEKVWVATHRLAARLLVAGGLIGAIAAWLGAPLADCFWLLVAALTVPVIYSLLLYKRLEREGEA